MSFGTCLLALQIHSNACLRLQLVSLRLLRTGSTSTVFRIQALAGNDAQAIHAFENVGKLRCEVRVSLFRGIT